MSTTQKIRENLYELPEGVAFGYKQLGLAPNEFYAAAKAIERLIAKGVIKRISTGVFYKPKQTPFGELKPNEEEILKSYLFDEGKRIAYITGTSVYNQMGLTTQVPQKIKISSRSKRISISKNNIQATPTKSYVDVKENNFYLLEFLDTLKNFKQIPDLDKNLAIRVLSQKLKNFLPDNIKLLVECSLAYPPRVRAFLGALLENVEQTIDLVELYQSLNPLSKYNYGIVEILPSAKNWNIK